MKDAPHQPKDTPFNFAPAQKPAPAPAPAAPSGRFVNGRTGKQETAK